MSNYCSIEEAWGGNFAKPTKPSKPKKKRIIIESDDYERAELPHRRRRKNPKRYKHTDIYDSQNYYTDNSNINSNVESYFDRYDNSRGIDRLPNHNGPETRSMLKDIHIDSKEKGDYMGYSDKDIYNYEEIQNTKPNRNRVHNDIYECPDDDELYNTDNESDVDKSDIENIPKHPEPTEESIEGFSNIENLSNSLSQDLNNGLTFHNNNNNNNNNNLNNNHNNIYDLILYIFTGVFYLVLCDFIYKLGKKTY